MQAVRKYLFVSDYENDRVLRFDFATKAFKDVFVQVNHWPLVSPVSHIMIQLTKLPRSRSQKGSGGLKDPWGIAFNKYDDPIQPRTFYVASGGTSAILQYDACDGSFIKKFAHVPGGPRGLTFHTLPSKHKPPRDQKMLLVASYYTHQVVKFNALTGSSLGVYASGVKNPIEVIVGPSASHNNPAHTANIFVSSNHDDAAIQFHATTGAFKAKFTDKTVSEPFGIVFAPGPAASPPIAGVESGPGGVFMTGPYAGQVIVKFDMNNGTYIEHFEDKDLRRPTDMEYDNKHLYVLDGATIRTYDAETGEFLEVWSSKDGMDGTHMLFHSM